MAATVTAVRQIDIFGDLRVAVADVQFDNSYPTGGLAVSAAQLGLGKVQFSISSVKAAGAGGISEVFYDDANSKLKAFAPSAEIANAVDLSANTVRVVAFGN